jgi:steroid delta-isomerase-like uncharacterized protein
MQGVEAPMIEMPSLSAIRWLSVQSAKARRPRSVRPALAWCMAAEENKAVLLRAWDAVYVQGRLDAVGEFVHDDVVAHESDADIRGIEAFMQYAAPYLAAFSDLSVTIEDIIAEGDRVAVRWIDRGTHTVATDEFGPPTGKRVEFEGVTLYRFTDGKVAELWDFMDSLGLTRQLARSARSVPEGPVPN